MEPTIPPDQGKNPENARTPGVHFWNAGEKPTIISPPNHPEMAMFDSEERIVGVGRATFSGQKGSLDFGDASVTALTANGVSYTTGSDAGASELFESGVILDHVLPGRTYIVTMATPHGMFSTELSPDEENDSEINNDLHIPGERFLHVMTREWTQTTDADGVQLPEDQQQTGLLFIDPTGDIPASLGFSFTVKR